ncbi:hypothetical protein [Paenibacillus jiagnxiensis]|uniref:hypothetical protein n=1 Tax=Paenibacillus jiagnxiensis TaxID=3228926 RepID=UPI0033B4AFF1
MKISFQKQLINPELPCHMDGYADRISYEQHDDLEINSLLIESNEIILIHVLDLILIEKQFGEKVKSTLSEKFSISKENIIIEATHTHSGPKVSTMFYPEITPSQDYLQLLLDMIVKNTEFCLNHKMEARAYYGICEINGYYCNRNDRSLPFNNKGYILQFRNHSNDPLVSLINIACHPTVLAKDNLFISSDYIGELREEYYHLNQTPAIIINGECGDVSTRFTRQGDDFAETRRIGKGIARVLAEVKDFREITMDNLCVSSFTLKIDKTIKPTVHLYEFDDIRFVTIPGEIVYNLGQLIRSQDGKPAFILAYANEYNGYAVDKEQYGKYFESSITNYPYGKADELVGGVLNLIKSKS